VAAARGRQSHPGFRHGGNALAMAASYDPIPRSFLGSAAVTFDTCEVNRRTWQLDAQDPVVAIETQADNLRR